MTLPTIQLEPDPRGLVVVALAGEHDLSSAEALRESLVEAARSPGMVVDLDMAEFVDSSILGVLVQAFRDARESGRGFVLVMGDQTPAPVRRVVSLTRLDHVLPTLPDRQAALAAALVPTAPVDNE
ncbi:MAG TPA: STAS domain-containing protein [Gaiellales bacterium]|nr:STAS domain-containing protein [Gaiellales bacterium]